MDDTSINLQTPFGLRDGRIVEPHQVKSGLACGCICPGCGSLLVAKQGTKQRRWHFAHYNATFSLSCIESAIHAAAKQILVEEMGLWVPERSISVSANDLSGTTHSHTGTLFESKYVKFDSCFEELWESQIRPDIVGTRRNKRMYVEMYFTHRVDEAKLQKIKTMGVGALEIDLSNIPRNSGMEQIRNCVVSDTSVKTWLFCPGEEQLRNKLQLELTENIEQRNREITIARENRKKTQLKRDKLLALDLQMEEAEHYEFRTKSLQEKELHIRNVLGFSGIWPYYLNKSFKVSDSIKELPRIWQGSLFAHFIFGKRVGTSLAVDDIVVWVIRRFGAKDAHNAANSVTNCLRYLSGCGFIAKPHQHVNDCADYIVVHPHLTPPEPVKRKPEKVEIKRNSTPPEPVHQKVLLPHVMWRAYWPTPEELRHSAQIPLRASLYESEYKELIGLLTSFPRETSPLQFAEEYFAKKSIPIENTLQFLIDINVAQRIKKWQFAHPA